MIKILHICQYYNNSWNYQENILPRYYAELGCDVIVITSDRKPFYRGDKEKRIIKEDIFFENGVKIRRIPIKLEYINRFVIFKNLYNVLEEEKPDCIFHHGITMPSVATAVRYKRNHPDTVLVVDSHSDIYNSGNKFISKYFYHNIIWRMLIKYWLPYIDKIYCVTPSVAKFELEFHGIPSNKIELLYLGSDIKHSHFDLEACKTIREKFCISENEVLIVTTGKLQTKKKTERLIMAVKRINNPNLRLMIIGTAESSRMKQLKKLAIDDSRIIFIGWVPSKDLYKYFSAADIGIWPACQTVTFQEAIGCSLPIIVKHYYGTEYLTQYQNGFQLYSDSVEEIIEKIEFLLSYPNVLKEMRERAQKLAENILSYELIAKKSLQPLYKRHYLTKNSYDARTRTDKNKKIRSII